MREWFKSREEIKAIADGVGIEIEFDSENPGITILNKQGEIISHKDFDEVWNDMCDALGFDKNNSKRKG